MKKVLILSGSPRKGGNSDLLCDEFLRGAQESGNEVQKIFVRSKKIAPCYYCRDHGGKCALNDDMSEILDAMPARSGSSCSRAFRPAGAPAPRF